MTKRTLFENQEHELLITDKFVQVGSSVYPLAFVKEVVTGDNKPRPIQYLRRFLNHFRKSQETIYFVALDGKKIFETTDEDVIIKFELWLLRAIAIHNREPDPTQPE